LIGTLLRGTLGSMRGVPILAAVKGLWKVDFSKN